MESLERAKKLLLWPWVFWRYWRTRKNTTEGRDSSPPRILCWSIWEVRYYGHTNRAFSKSHARHRGGENADHRGYWLSTRDSRDSPSILALLFIGLKWKPPDDRCSSV